jgi:pleiotropic regulator 1
MDQLGRLSQLNADSARDLMGPPSFLAPMENEKAWTLRRAALLRGLFPKFAEKSLGGGAAAPPASRALINLSSVRAANVAAPPSVSVPERKRDRQGESPVSAAIVTVDPSILRETTRQRLEQDGASALSMTKHPQWQPSKTLVSHQGWVTAVAFHPSNLWFATGSTDSVIKIWSLASGELRLNFTGHKEAVRSLAVREKAMFSGSDDHAIKMWDLEKNQIVRDYFGHVSAVHCVAAHPALDLVFSGGRDKSVRVWDVRTQTAVRTFYDHQDSVLSIAAQSAEPQLISGSGDCMVLLWDIAMGKVTTRITRHKKPIRSLCLHPVENTFISCGADAIRKWKLPEGSFMTNIGERRQDEAAIAPSIWNCLAVNPSGCLFAGAEDGQMLFTDYESGAVVQRRKTKPLPGTPGGTSSIMCAAFDPMSGTRLVTGETDKSVKIWKPKE